MGPARRAFRLARPALAVLGALIAVALAPHAAWADTIPTPEPTSTPDATVAIVAVGDLMCHSQIFGAALWHGVYDFRPAFAPVVADIRAADLALGNLETTLKSGGPYSGYPQFRSPRAYADALKWAGFDVLTTANNHALDGGATGVRYTARILASRGFAHTGTNREGPAIVERKGVRIAVLAYTYATNGIHSPFSGAVNRIGLARMRTAIAAAHKKADLVVLCLHWGNEYSAAPEAKTVSLGKALVDAGADLILGSHPHVVRPVRKYRGRYIVYSMGNFISGQEGRRTDLGILVRVTVTRVNDVTKVASLKVVPTFRDRSPGAGRSSYRVVRISRALAHPDKRTSKADRARMRTYRAYCRRMFGKLL